MFTPALARVMVALISAISDISKMSSFEFQLLSLIGLDMIDENSSKNFSELVFVFF